MTSTITRTKRVENLGQRLEDALAHAAQDPEVPCVMAAVHAPRLDLHWQGACRGPRAQDADPVAADVPFRVASVAKLFTAAAVLRLIEEGRLSLHGPLYGALTGRISPELAQLLASGGHDPARITLSHLLTHTSGLPDHTHSAHYEQDCVGTPERVWKRHEQVRLAMEMGPPTVIPGQRFDYSDTGYVILGEVIEVATGQALGPAVRHLLGFEQLGLHRTHWERQEPDPSPGTRARQCMREHDMSELDPSFDLYGGGGVVSTVGDLCRFTAALMAGRVFKHPGTLAAALVVPPAERAGGSFMHSRLAMVLPLGQAFGWGHLGYWGCGVVCCPDLEITVAATINQPYPREAGLRRELVSTLGVMVVAAQLEGSD